MKKILSYLIICLFITSINAQDVIVDLLQWNVNPIVNSSFVPSSAINTYGYDASASLNLVQNINGGASWGNIPTGELDENNYIKIEFTVAGDKSIDITNIQFSAASSSSFPFLKLITIN